MYSDRNIGRPKAVAYSNAMGLQGSSCRSALTTCQNNDPEVTIASPNAAPSKTSKALRAVSSGTLELLCVWEEQKEYGGSVRWSSSASRSQNEPESIQVVLSSYLEAL